RLLLFPSTTLFRSHGVVRFHRAGRSAAGGGADGGLGRRGLSAGRVGAGMAADLAGPRSRAHRMSLPMAPGAHGQAAAQAALARLWRWARFTALNRARKLAVVRFSSIPMPCSERPLSMRISI